MKNTLFISGLLMILLTSGLALGFSKTIRMNMIIGGIIPVLLMLNVLYSVIKAIKVKAKAKAKYKAPDLSIKYKAL
ncbi:MULTISPECIES: hypothetical protein [Elizabethkingia]|uniref:hypothetical protein n=1 Tax=Elizabethkingia TaxID=308865 RepID=UPI000442C301|nr:MULTISPECIES: hypothetical protein [Elizabethkingia]MCT3754309.1 hypothetical protein [Elizabethkingia anophelis]MCT3775225.1 hypothetical protein [Elizabethkingia anophelis]MCT3782712.1 hypothetical protein [Elizabethkingia anophelis]MCT3789946.1 hypothetical protein [Elizabethkingia anophelis]MCT3793115.1 hypothetical protein [Elizabethkingia anophelis]